MGPNLFHHKLTMFSVFRCTVSYPIGLMRAHKTDCRLTSTVMRSTPAGNAKLLTSSCSYGKICAVHTHSNITMKAC